MKEFIDALREKAFSESLPVMRKETCQILREIAERKNPSRILEIGTCIGISGLTVLSACDGKITTVEIDENRLLEAKENFIKCGFKERVNLILGDCNEVLQYLRGNKYDMVILDGPKSAISVHYEYALEMLDKGGVIFIDDINYHGMIKADGAPHKQRTIILALREFLTKLKSDERVNAVLYDKDDGIAVVEKI